MNSTFKPRKKSMRDAYAERQKALGYPKAHRKPQAPAKRPWVAEPRKSLKKVSTARQREMAQYYRDRREWLSRPENAGCAICLCLDQGAAPATECHHSRGRIGRLLLDRRFWVPSCRSCREIPHERPAWAREVGILCKASEWNVYPR